MLNKNQSHKRNSLKYALVLPALIAFIVFFQIQTIAQEKETKNSTSIIEIHEGGEITFDATESDKSLSTLKNAFKEEKITTEISKIKRNSIGEITGICIKMKCEDGRKKELKINQSTPIDKILIYTNRLKNGSYDFGIKQISMSKIAQTSDYSYPNSSENDNEEAYSYSYSDDFPSPPVAPVAPVAPVVNIDYAPFPNMPTPPSPPVGTTINNEKEWKIFEKKLEEYEKKVEALEPEMEAYAKKMSKIDEQMKPFEKEMELYEQKMKKFEEEMQRYVEKLEAHVAEKRVKAKAEKK